MVWVLPMKFRGLGFIGLGGRSCLGISVFPRCPIYNLGVQGFPGRNLLCRGLGFGEPLVSYVVLLDCQVGSYVLAAPRMLRQGH